MSDQGGQRGGRGRHWLLLGLVAVMGASVGSAAFVALLDGGGGESVGAAPTAPATPASAAAEPDEDLGFVLYELRGTTRRADITITTSDGMEQATGVRVPLQSEDGDYWLRVYVGPGGFASITAQNAEPSGSLTCRIRDAATLDILAENESTGGFAVVTCDATAPG